ncbi:BglG family transcription antiterminator LicT [Treponema lecithinolyticum]|uniref:Transcription antiterminator LicT n=1 Tax=Treponema lecithinolyticum ATCC 700332 TaxID=1321815 RepID=A0ABN0P0M4_TRELE|nr:PRD domain-containing protein [Treponema lecithinolyticum]ERJ93987.1 putative transcription antiterminator LicT [Treponema lecithinolyticum ATCC 700332]
MKIIKILNNNAIICTDSNNIEKIALGKGLGFGCRIGDTVQENKIEKVFTPDTDEVKSRFQQIVAEIPIAYILLTEKIICAAKSRLPILHDTIYVTLSDHIGIAIERYKQNIILKNPLLTDIQRFYPTEYAVSKQALELMEKETGIHFENDEAGFIAMHFVNAELNIDMHTVTDITQIIDDIVNIINDYLKNRYDEHSFAWYRLLTHIKFFAQRLKNGEDYDIEESALFNKVYTLYPESYCCVKLISEHLQKKYNHTVSSEEKAYLILHIQRLKNALCNTKAGEQ